ncbi:Golgi apparatus membrane protein TVP23 [Suillus subaureus]|uniref:Golgi apparatus membrane protein TVP23 n=1 Tax=Suillus subaureus TaxID=48587 RepID=A0A9P7JJ92_9AGAM|nr:Golgi apparatus membrane protein TVP23 [Suillus subaureus]KAG1826148.1 Golgi apparatus membrane protein TVP23 [Suillus subaureus]
MSTNSSLLQTIEPDDPSVAQAPSRNTVSNTRPAVVLTPNNLASAPADAESGIAGILRQSAHPAALFCLYFFRTSAIAVYILCGLLTNNYVLSTVVVVVLLAMDFWNCRNVAGRTLVGLRFWNQVDDDGESYWVFESRDPTRPANPVDAKMFWIALYVFPALWLLLFIVSILHFSLSFIPIVALALVFNFTNAVGFTYADRDAKQRWANSIASSGWNMGMGGIGGQILGSAMKNSVGRLFG